MCMIKCVDDTACFISPRRWINSLSNNAHITLSVRSGSKLKANSNLERRNEMYTLVITCLSLVHLCSSQQWHLKTRKKTIQIHTVRPWNVTHVWAATLVYHIYPKFVVSNVKHMSTDTGLVCYWWSVINWFICNLWCFGSEMTRTVTPWPTNKKF